MQLATNIKTCKTSFEIIKGENTLSRWVKAFQQAALLLKGF